MSSVIKSSQVKLTVNNIVEDKLYKQKQSLEQKKEFLNKTKYEYEKIINTAKQQADDILSKAIHEASEGKASIIESAKREAENLKEEKKKEGHGEGYREGYESGFHEGNSKGYEEGFSQGRSESEKLIEEANKIKKEYLQEREKTLGSIEKDVISLVLHTCEKILNQSLIENEETIVDLVLKGIASLDNKDSVIVRVSKEDFEKVEESKENILSKASLIESLDIKWDSNLQKGECVVESSKGSVEVSISTQIDKMKEMIEELLDSE